MNIICVGINHRTAPIEVREKLWFSNEEVPEVLSYLKEHAVKECALISTCNRTELYYVPSSAEMNGLHAWKVLSEQKHSSDVVDEKNFYTFSGIPAIQQLYRVVSGIDSMVLGDVQITNQIKEAFSIAHDKHTTGILLHRLYTSALHVGKRARTETEIGEGAVSISYAAAELASKIFEDLSKRTAMLIGAGETGKLTAKHLKSRNLGKFIFCNRTREHAETLAQQLGGTVIDFDKMTSELQHIDILICSVHSTQFVLTEQQLRQAMKSRGNRPLFIIDLGVPRNIDPKVNIIDNVFLHDIDALNHIIDGNLSHRKSQVPLVETIIAEEVHEFERWYKSLDVSPTIQELQEQIEAIRREEVSKHLHHFGEEKQEAIDMLTKRIVNKILHTPMTNLKNGTGEHPEDETRTKVFFLRHLFGLDKRTHREERH